MSTPRIAVALAAAFAASTASVFPPASPPGKKPASASPLAPAARAVTSATAERAWPPLGLGADAPTDVTARLERTSTGAHRLVVDRPGTFMHLRYREAVSAGPDWAALELRAGDRAPESDVAVWESTDPQTLSTSRGLVRFGLRGGARPEAAAAEPPRLGPRDTTTVRACQAHHDGESGFAVVCRIGMQTSGVRAIRPASPRPLAGAWVWDVPAKAKAKTPASRFVRIDLPLSPGGAEAGAIAYVHGAKGFVVRAEATWPSREEPPAVLFTETSRTQPVSPFFSWAAPLVRR